MTEVFVNGKYTMPVDNIYQFKGHGSSALHGIEITTGRAKTTVATKRNKFLGELNGGVIDLLLSEEKPKAKKVTLKADRIKEYFNDDYSNDEIEEVIYELLEKWKQEGGRG